MERSVDVSYVQIHGERIAFREAGRGETIVLLHGMGGSSDTRAAFLRTLRSVVDYRGLSVSALSRLRLQAGVPTLMIWGDRDTIIPATHGAAALAARPGSRLEVFPGLGNFAHVQSPEAVVTAINHFIGTQHGANAAAAQVTSAHKKPKQAPTTSDRARRALPEKLEARQSSNSRRAY